MFEFISQRFLKPSNANADMMGNPIHPATELTLTIWDNFVFSIGITTKFPAHQLDWFLIVVLTLLLCNLLYSEVFYIG